MGKGSHLGWKAVSRPRAKSSGPGGKPVAQGVWTASRGTIYKGQTEWQGQHRSPEADTPGLRGEEGWMKGGERGTKRGSGGRVCGCPGNQEALRRTDHRTSAHLSLPLPFTSSEGPKMVPRASLQGTEPGSRGRGTRLSGGWMLWTESHSRFQVQDPIPVSLPQEEEEACGAKTLLHPRSRESRAPFHPR